jgi:hypothetical protein
MATSVPSTTPQSLPEQLLDEAADAFTRAADGDKTNILALHNLALVQVRHTSDIYTHEHIIQLEFGKCASKLYRLNIILSTVQALQRKVGEALCRARASLTHSGQQNPATWALIALLLSAQRQFELAAEAVSAALPHAQPEMLRLLLRIKAAILAAAGWCMGCVPAVGWYCLVFHIHDLKPLLLSPQEGEGRP